MLWHGRPEDPGALSWFQICDFVVCCCKDAMLDEIAKMQGPEGSLARQAPEKERTHCCGTWDSWQSFRRATTGNFSMPIHASLRLRL